MLDRYTLGNVYHMDGMGVPAHDDGQQIVVWQARLMRMSATCLASNGCLPALQLCMSCISCRTDAHSLPGLVLIGALALWQSLGHSNMRTY